MENKIYVLTFDTRPMTFSTLEVKGIAPCNQIKYNLIFSTKIWAFHEFFGTQRDDRYIWG